MTSQKTYIFWEIWDSQVVEQFIAVTTMCGFNAFPSIAYELQPLKKNVPYGASSKMPEAVSPEPFAVGV